MKYSFLLLIVALFFIGCEENSGNDDPVIEAPLVSLNYDRSNLTAPQLSSGTYEAAAKFTSNETSNMQGGQLTEVYFYILDAPGSATIKIYKGTSASDGFPVSTVYSKSVSNDLESSAWNHHILDTPVDIDQEDIWIAVRFQAGSASQIIGCDVGPAAANGDWLFENADGNWEKLVSRSGNEANINWNIRGVVDPS